uniref:Ig-like domain-containing protein n=1 Tax=Oryzias melastigma TaxID=30732 RepID=A0A3B3BQF6_ORYME
MKAGVHILCSFLAELKNITAEPGQNVTLTCRLSDQNQVLVLEWSRTDLQEDEYVFLYRDDKSDSDHQHKSFRNRVFLKDSRMGDGDLSVVLKNATTDDNGTYQSRVEGNGRTRRSVLDSPPICTIHLLVILPGEQRDSEVK